MQVFMFMLTPPACALARPDTFVFPCWTGPLWPCLLVPGAPSRVNAFWSVSSIRVASKEGRPEAKKAPQLESTEASTAPVRGWWPCLVRLWKEDGLPDTASSRSPHLPVSPSSPASPSPPPPPMADVVVSFDCIGKLQWYSKHPERYDDKWVQIPVNYFLLKSKFHSVCC